MIPIKFLSSKKIIEFMSNRMAVLYDQLIRDFSGDIQSRLYEWREVKYWKEAIERGEFDTELQEVYIILSVAQQEIVEFTYYTNKEEVSKRVDELNGLVNHLEYWYITMYSNHRNFRKE